MKTPRPVPRELGSSFTVQEARGAGVSAGRLRRFDLGAPFHGIRTAPNAQSERTEPKLDTTSLFDRQRAERREQALRYVPRLRPGQFLSHETAVALLDGPLPLITSGGEAVDGMTLPVHVSTLGDAPLVRARGVRGHRADVRTTRLIDFGGFLVADHATAWAELGSWSVPDLVALGDHFCRAWRAGPGRPDAGRAHLTTITELRQRITGVRRHGIGRLREALQLIREDSWSPRESKLRCLIVRDGLPEPLLNHDIYDGHGWFLGCFDLVYLKEKVAIEYNGLLHAANYAVDVERIAALRAAGWTVIEVTSALLARPTELLFRVRRALRR